MEILLADVDHIWSELSSAPLEKPLDFRNIKRMATLVRDRPRCVRPSGLGTWVSDVNEASIISVGSECDNAAVFDKLQFVDVMARADKLKFVGHLANESNSGEQLTGIEGLT